MRRWTLLFVVPLLVLTACGGGKKSTSDASSRADQTGSVDSSATGDSMVENAASGGTEQSPSASDKPTVQIPKALPTSLVITDLVAGTGDKAAAGDTVFVHYVGVRSRDGKEFDSNFGADPFPVTIGAGRVIKGWEQGLVGTQVGGRRQLDIPSDLAYGEQSMGDVIGKNEALSFVIEILALVHPADPAQEPQVTVKSSKAAEVSSVDLVVGTGDAVAAGDTTVFDFVLYRGDTGAKVYSSWTEEPATVALSTEALNDTQTGALFAGLIGMKVGGRRQLIIPAAQAFGGAGNESLGLPPGVDLIFVADLRAVV